MTYNINPDELLCVICSRKKGAAKEEIINIFNQYDYEIDEKLWNKIKYYNINYDGVYFDTELRSWRYYDDYTTSIIETVFNPNHGTTLPLWIKNDLSKFKDIFKKEQFAI